MGFTPQEVNAMSIWQFLAVCDGFAKANSADGDKRLTRREKDDLWEWLEE